MCRQLVEQEAGDCIRSDYRNGRGAGYLVLGRKLASINGCPGAYLMRRRSKICAKRLNKSTIATALVFLAIALDARVCAAAEAPGYTLYRNSLTDAQLRLHVASFDAAEGPAYNRENCEQARALFQAQPGVKTNFWCEPGRFRSIPRNEPTLSKQFTTGTSEARTCSPSAAELAKKAGAPRSVADYSCPK